MAQCAWCERELSEEHGYSEDGFAICASYSNPPTPRYNNCKARKARLKAKKTASEASSASQGHSALIEALQILISQNDELIALQKQSLSQPRMATIKTEVTVPFDDSMDSLEIKQATVDSAAITQNFLKSMYALNPDKKPKAANPKAMDVPQFEAPDFDDDFEIGIVQ